MPAEALAQLRDYRVAWPWIVPRSEVFDLADDLHQRFRIAWWDALIIAACLDAGVKRFYTEDLPGWKPPAGLEIVNPFTSESGR